MTQDEIMEMARQTGVLAGYEGEPSLLVIFAKGLMDIEREACARVCDDINAKYKWPEDTAERVASQWCADSIRARGQA